MSFICVYLCFFYSEQYLIHKTLAGGGFLFGHPLLPVVGPRWDVFTCSPYSPGFAGGSEAHSVGFIVVGEFLTDRIERQFTLQ